MEPFKPTRWPSPRRCACRTSTPTRSFPRAFYWRKRGDGWGHLLFHDLRFDDAGAPKPLFVLEPRRISRRAHPGCGPKFRLRLLARARRLGALRLRHQVSWRLVSATFFNNCMQNGLLPVQLPAQSVEALIGALQQVPGLHVGVDLEQQCVTGPDGITHAFEIDPFS